MASQSKPKPLEELSDGDLSEIKKDPVWKTWFKEKGKFDEDKTHPKNEETLSYLKERGFNARVSDKPCPNCHKQGGLVEVQDKKTGKWSGGGLNAREHTSHEFHPDKPNVSTLGGKKFSRPFTNTHGKEICPNCDAKQQDKEISEDYSSSYARQLGRHQSDKEKEKLKNKGLGDIAAEVVAGGAKFGSKFTESLSEELSGKPSAKQPEAPQLDHPSEPITSTPTPATTVSAPKSPTKMKPTGATSGATPAPSKAAIKSWESWLEKRRSGKGRRRIKDPDEEEPEDTEWMPVNKRQGEKIGYTEEHEDIRTSRAAGQATPQAEQFERSRPQVKRIQEEPKVRRRTGTSEVPESKGDEVYPRGTVHPLPEVNPKTGLQTGKDAKDIHGKKIYTHVGGSPTGKKTKPLPKEEKRGYKDKPVPKKHTSNLPKHRKRFHYGKSESFVYKIWLMKEKPKKDEGQIKQEPKGAMGVLRKKPVTYGTSIGTGLGEGEKQHEVKPDKDYKEDYKPQAQVSARSFQAGRPKAEGSTVDLKEHHAGLKRLIGRLRTGKWGRAASTGASPIDTETGGSTKRKIPPTGTKPDMKVDKPSGMTEGEWQKKLVAERTASQKANYGKKPRKDKYGDFDDPKTLVPRITEGKGFPKEMSDATMGTTGSGRPKGSILIQNPTEQEKGQKYWSGRVADFIKQQKKETERLRELAEGLDKSSKKRVRLGDISSLQKLPKGKPSKYKDPQEMSKYPKKPVMGKGKQVKYKAWLKEKDALTGEGTGKIIAGTSIRRRRGTKEQTSQGQATDARHLDSPSGASGDSARERFHSEIGNVTDRPAPDKTDSYYRSDRHDKTPPKQRGGKRVAATPQGHGLKYRKEPFEGKEQDWKKIDDAVQSVRAEKLEERAGKGIPYGKSLWKAWFVDITKPAALPKGTKDNTSISEVAQEHNATESQLKLTPNQRKQYHQEKEDYDKYGHFFLPSNRRQPANPPKKGWKKWMERNVAAKGALGALGEGKLNRYTGKKMKLVPRKTDRKEKPIKEGQKKLDEFKEKTDYFIEEIKMNIVYEDKIAPLIGAIAGAVGRGAMSVGRGLARGAKGQAGNIGQFAGGMMEGLAGDEEKMEEEEQ